jgi:hypothetical protein
MIPTQPAWPASLANAESWSDTKDPIIVRYKVTCRLHLVSQPMRSSTLRPNRSSFLSYGEKLIWQRLELQIEFKDTVVPGLQRENNF